ncbi:CLUMA_CG003038, isoform A [Clunio marinus]|uniref:Histone acetyltransferase type B catalytic subunit n=1 Tax=Clunio marinus TaxID=568069 RepID=A0A1J1HMJ9_9DIPT|nr:CLUMA_CG003038, isoform A [Clunio marinus]
MANLESFVCEAVDAVKFKLIRDRSDVNDPDNGFKPEMAHQVFGETENIFGYKDLQINVYFSADELDIYYDVKYTTKVDDLTNNQGLKADNVNVITEFFPTGYYTNLEEFLNVSEKKSKMFEPAGEMICEFKTDERTFQIHLCTSTTSNFLKYHERLESFLFWYVDASSRIAQDDRWRFFVVFEKFVNNEGETRYASVGYASVYQYYHYPDKIRPRVSQFLILPPFQRKGIGSKLLQTIYKHYQNNEKVCDITVEDASEDFQRLRNTIDARMLKTLPAFVVDNLKKGFNMAMAQEAKDKFKINPKQSRIVCEILRLGVIDTNNKAEYKAYRIDVKKRLNMNYLKEKRDMKKLTDRGFKVPADKKLLLPSVEENMEQLEGMYRETEDYYRGVLERV